jgi:hypothetical protein
VSIEELGVKLNRAPKSLYPALRALVGKGRLKLKYPDAPNSPKQAYRAAGEE